MMRAIQPELRPQPPKRSRSWPRGHHTADHYYTGAAIAFLSFLDRAAISQAAPSISREMHLSPALMGLVFSAFGFTYAAFEMPSGWLCDRFANAGF